MNDEQITELIKKYKAGRLTPEEKAILESWYIDQAANSNFELNPDEIYKNLALIGKQLPLKYSNAYIKPLWRNLAAAAILIFILLGGYFLLHQKKIASPSALVKNDIAPGKSKATLILANGKKVALSRMVNGQFAGIAVNNIKTGVLTYTVQAVAGETKNTSQFNTLETANCEQYEVILSDNTHVWLNASSSIKYPIAFTGKERIVELTGEAYFEIAHHEAMPFKIKTQQQEVEVLGTHFDINAYTDEKATATTLIEGSVKVSLVSNHKSIVIRPGEQATGNNTELTVKQIDTDAAIAWKNGYFQFDDESLESVMRKISRWYNIEIEYQESALKDQRFSGTVSRYKNISQIIKVLELTNAVHFKIQDNKILVTK